MRTKLFLLLAAALALIFCCSTAACEEPAVCTIQTGEGWSWSRGAFNTFSGKIDLSGCSGKELTVMMSTDLDYDEENEQNGMPVFTAVNGKRIVMTKQSDTAMVTLDSDSLQMVFDGSLRLPEKGHYSQITFTFTVSGTDGSEQKRFDFRINSGGNSGDKLNNTFYIPFNIEIVTVGLGITSATVWLTVLAMRRSKYKSNRTGD